MYLCYTTKIIETSFFLSIDFSSKKLFIDYKLLNIFDLCKYKSLICMHRIYYKTCNLCRGGKGEVAIINMPRKISNISINTEF